MRCLALAEQELGAPLPCEAYLFGHTHRAGIGRTTDREGRPLLIANDPEQDVAVVLRKTGLKSGRHGNATGVERVQEPGIAELALGAARTLGLTGPVDIDIRLRNDGTPLVLEINARFGANSANAPEVLDAVLGSRLAVAA